MTTTTAKYEIASQSSAKTITHYSAWSSIYCDTATTRFTIHGEVFAVNTIEVSSEWTSQDSAPSFDGTSYYDPSFKVSAWSVLANGKAGNKHKYVNFSFEQILMYTDIPSSMINALKADFEEQVACAQVTA